MGKKKTHEEFVEELKIRNPHFDNLEFVNKYVNAKTHITCRCKTHDYIWDAHPWSLLQGSGCPICGRERTYNSTTFTHEKFLDKMRGINSNIEILGHYTRAVEKIKCRCKICGNVWYPTASNILAGHGCKKCMDNTLSSDRRKNIESLYEQSKEIAKIIDIDFSCYQNGNSKLSCTCKVCNNKWKVTYKNLLAGRGCPKCNKNSKGEAKISLFLDTQSIYFIQNYSFDELVSNNNYKLSYDFYLPKYNLLIEYQGEQHEHPVKHFGGKEQFKKQQEHDKRKREYAKEHGIELLEIWYWDYNKIDKILNDKLNINDNKKSA